MQGLEKIKVEQGVYDAAEELLDLAEWLRGFYVALKVSGFEDKLAGEITRSAAMGLLDGKMRG